MEILGPELFKFLVSNLRQLLRYSVGSPNKIISLLKTNYYDFLKLIDHFISSADKKKPCLIRRYSNFKRVALFSIIDLTLKKFIFVGGSMQEE